VTQIKQSFNFLTLTYDASEGAGQRWGIVNAGQQVYDDAMILYQGDTTGSAQPFCAVLVKEKIDIRGLNQEEKTLMFNGGLVQEPLFFTQEIRPGGVGGLIAAPAGSGMYVTDIMTTTPIYPIGETYDEQLLSLFNSVLYAGFEYSTLNFEHIILAQSRELAMTTTTGAWSRPEEMSRKRFGSGTPVAGEFIHCYRMVYVQFGGVAAADDLSVYIPNARYLLSAQVKEEKEYVRMMRLARENEPWQRFDRD
jgi:hypothetical protein